MEFTPGLPSIPHHGREQARSPGRIAPWGVALTTSKMGDVPCGSCNLCCTRPHLHADLLPSELPAFPEAVSDEVMGGSWRLPKKDNGECVHLLNGQCSIYDRRPQSCRTYDCRLHLFWLKPPERASADFARMVFDMWDDWDIETPEDVDHMFAISRAVTEAIRQQASEGPIGGLALTVSIVKLYNHYLPKARVNREQMGFETAREWARHNDRTLRHNLMQVLDRTVWVREPPSTAPRLMDMAPLGDAAKQVATRICTALEKEGFKSS